MCSLIRAQRRLLSYLRIHAGHLLASTAVGAVYYYAAWFKLVNHDYFKTTLAAYGFFPDTLVPVLAWIVPCLEMAVGVSLVFCLHQRAGLLGGTVLSVLFTIVVCLAYFSGKAVDCGCLVRGEKLDGSVVVRDAVLVATLLMVDSNPVTQTVRRIARRRD
ncbi:MAG: hypothetical protein K6U08_01825 [Firmicutes bacterium]|nr:hypothetical protein [Bacillota bacterium]